MRHHRDDWELFGANEPYFAVLTENRFRREQLTTDAQREFYETGERDLERFLGLVSEARSGPTTIRHALDFGCGVGRLSVPLARRAGHVTGLDVSTAMLRHAAAAAAAAQLSNVTFLNVDDLEALESNVFDLVVSYMVFQHVPPHETELYLEQIFRVAAPRAALILHFSLSRPGGLFRRLLRLLRSRSRLVHRVVSAMRGEEHLPYMQMNEYDLNEISRTLRCAAFDVRGVHPTNHGGIPGAIVIAIRD